MDDNGPRETKAEPSITAAQASYLSCDNSDRFISGLHNTKTLMDKQ